MKAIGFGIERTGLLALHLPRVILAAVLLVSLVAAYGMSQLKGDDAIAELFRSKTPEFAAYEEMRARFPTSEFDVFVVVSGPDIVSAERLEGLRGIHLELQFGEAVEGVLSLFSMRTAPDARGYAPTLVPGDLPAAGPEFDALARTIMAHPLIGGKLVSYPDGGEQLAILIVTLKRDRVAEMGLAAAIAEISALAETATQSSNGLSVSLSGAPVMQLEVRDALQGDSLLFNLIGFLVGSVICFWFFRRWTLVFIASTCPAIAALWILGFMGLWGIKLNSVLNVIPPLVMVIAYCDSMHVVYAIRRRLIEGLSPRAATRAAIHVVGPACVLTSLTTATAMAAMLYTDSALIRTFGAVAAIGAVLAFVVVILVAPALAMVMLRAEAEGPRVRRAAYGMGALERFSERLADHIAPRARMIAGLGLMLVAFGMYFHAQLSPHYRLSDQVPQNRSSVAASERIDEKLTGAHPIHVMVQWPEARAYDSPEVLGVMAATHALLERQPAVGNVWSIETLTRWIREAGQDPQAVMAGYVELLPDHLVSRFLNKGAAAGLVTGRLPNLDAEQTVPIVAEINRKLDQLRAQYPDYQFVISGLSTVSAQSSARIITQLNLSLLMAVVVVIGMIGIAFRSPRAALLSIFPNVFPIVAAGTALHATGAGLDYASVMALTVAFGLAVDDTIHFLSRYHDEQASGGSATDAVRETLSRIGPVLILTTIVLVFGMAVTLVSDLPPMRLFGGLCMATLVGALLADLIFLPALIMASRGDPEPQPREQPAE